MVRCGDDHSWSRVVLKTLAMLNESLTEIEGSTQVDLLDMVSRVYGDVRQSAK